MRRQPKTEQADHEAHAPGHEGEALEPVDAGDIGRGGEGGGVGAHGFSVHGVGLGAGPGVAAAWSSSAWIAWRRSGGRTERSASFAVCRYCSTRM